DAQARRAYRDRLAELREELEEAEGHNDRGRVERLRGEIALLSEQLAGAVGLGGRERRAGRAAGRARINVQRRLADAMKRIEEAAPMLGRHLVASVRTGAVCVYRPDRPLARR